MTANWQLLSIPIGTAPIQGPGLGDAPLGDVILTPTGAEPPIVQWAQPDLMRAWAAQARADLAPLAPYVLAPGQHAPPPATLAQLRTVLADIANYYTAGDTTWHAHPFARGLYRQYWAGAPIVRGGSVTDSLFGLYSYAPGDVPRGTIPTQARRAYCAARGGCGAQMAFHYVPPVLLGETVAPGYEGADEGVMGQSPVVNAAWSPALDPGLWPFGDDPGTGHLQDGAGAPFLPEFLGAVADVRGAVATDVTPADAYPTQRCTSRAGTISCPGIDDPALRAGVVRDLNSLWFDERLPSPLDPDQTVYAWLGAQGSWFVPWLQAWVDELNIADPLDVIRASRVYAAYANAQTLLAAGGAAAAVSDAINAATAQAAGDARGITAIHSVSAVGAALAGPAAIAIATALGAVAAIGSAATAGIGALVAGAVIFVGTVAAALYHAAPNAPYGRDDLGRPKPSFERAWLAGDPTCDPANTWAPAIDVPAPPGFVSSYAGPACTPATLSPLLVNRVTHAIFIPGATTPLVVNPPPPPFVQPGAPPLPPLNPLAPLQGTAVATTPATSPVLIVAGVAVVGAAIVAAVRALRNRDARRPASPARSSRRSSARR